MFNNKLFSMNLWRRAPWRGTYQCEAPFRFVYIENIQRGSSRTAGSTIRPRYSFAKSVESGLAAIR